VACPKPREAPVISAVGIVATPRTVTCPVATDGCRIW
jgi:hypothetical protein